MLNVRNFLKLDLFLVGLGDMYSLDHGTEVETASIILLQVVLCFSQALLECCQGILCAGILLQNLFKGDRLTFVAFLFANKKVRTIITPVIVCKTGCRKAVAS